MVKHKDAIKVRYYKSKACLLANNCCEKCEAMYEYKDGKYCCFDNVMRFIEYVNKYKIEIWWGDNIKLTFEERNTQERLLYEAFKDIKYRNFDEQYGLEADFLTQFTDVAIRMIINQMIDNGVRVCYQF